MKELIVLHSAFHSGSKLANYFNSRSLKVTLENKKQAIKCNQKALEKEKNDSNDIKICRTQENTK